MAKKEKGATAKDAHILLELYRLRCEPTMRKARTFMTGEFWPQSYEEFRALLFDFRSSGKNSSIPSSPPALRSWSINR